MGKNRWSLILVAVCLIFAFSMSPVEAQQKEKGPRCSDGDDNDGDGTADCGQALDLINGGFFDADPNCNCGGEDPEPAKVEICHFSPNRMHCEGMGGLVRTIQINKLQGHLDHGDCQEDQYSFDTEDCSGHCIANEPFGDNHDCSNLNPGIGE